MKLNKENTQSLVLGRIVQDKYKWVMVDDRIQAYIYDNDRGGYNKKSGGKSKYVILYINLTMAILRSLYYYFKQYFITSTNSKRLYEYVILESDVEYRHLNIGKILDLDKYYFETIKSFDFNNMMSFEKVELLVLIKQVWRSIILYHHVISLNFPKQLECILVRNAPTFISSYAYLVSFFLAIKEKNKLCRIYTAAGESLSSYASVFAGLEVNFLSHGYLSKNASYSYPCFKSIYVYFIEDKKYLENINLPFNIFVYNFKRLKRLNSSIIIFLDHYHHNDYKILSDVVNLFISNAYEVHVKIHPVLEINKHQKVWINNNNIKLIDNKELWDAYSSINKIKPKFTIGSVSTALGESLNMGVIPISVDVLAKEADNYNAVSSKYIYPIQKRTISWKLESNIVVDLIKNRLAYGEILTMLKER